MKDEANKKFLLTELGDIIYNPANVVFGAIHRNSYGKGCLSPIYRIFETNQNSRFLECVVRSDSFIKKLAQKTEGSVVKLKTLKPEAFLEMNVFISPIPEEQEKIASYIDTIDNLITLHQRKCYAVKIVVIMSKKKHIFINYTNEWEQRKLEDVVGVYDGTHQTPNYQDHGVMFVSVEDIQTLTSEKYISEEDYEKNYSVVPEQGDILMTRIGDIGTANIVKSAEPLAYYVSLALLKNKGVNAEFLKSNIAAPAFQNELWLRTLHTAYPKKINKDEIGKCLIFIAPNIREQEQIGKFFEGIDNLITLHHRKYYVVKIVVITSKKMHIFINYTNEWEQRKLGDMLDRYEDPVETPHDGYERIGIRSHAKGVFHSYVEPGKELDTAKMHRVASDKFILNITFAWEHAVAITEEEDAGTLVSHRFPQFSFHKELKSHFFKFLMLDRKFREYLELCSPGGAGRNRVLNINDMLKYKINVPSVEEQTKIGEYFDNLDNLITLHQCKPT